jgi:hypothetical protein
MMFSSPVYCAVCGEPFVSGECDHQSTCVYAGKHRESQHNSAEETVNNPKHYTNHPSGIECIQITEHFCNNLGNVIKYIWRAEEKGAPLQDLKKAQWYLSREIERRERVRDKA